MSNEKKLARNKKWEEEMKYCVFTRSKGIERK